MRTIECWMPVGVPASGKSTWAKAKVAEAPAEWVRVNNDDLRAMCNGSVWSRGYDKFVAEVRATLIKEAFIHDKNVIVDNLNINKQHFTEVCKIAKASGKQITVSEKHFYVPLEVAIERDSKREGVASVGKKVIEEWFKRSGGEKLKDYQPRIATIEPRKRNELVAYDPKLPDCIVADMDGTIALMGKRSPYDASNCDLIDKPNEYVIQSILARRTRGILNGNGGYLIICSGREQKHEPETRRFIENHLMLPAGDYALFMRTTGDSRPDDVIKEEIYHANIEGKYNVLCVFDDRLKVCRLWHGLGLGLFRCGDPDASF
jgi:predicted kinase